MPLKSLLCSNQKYKILQKHSNNPTLKLNFLIYDKILVILKFFDNSRSVCSLSFKNIKYSIVDGELFYLHVQDVQKFYLDTRHCLVSHNLTQSVVTSAALATPQFLGK